MEDILQILGNLKVSSPVESKKLPVKSKKLAYCAWAIKPTPDLLDPTTITKGNILENYLVPVLKASDLPVVKNPILPSPMTIQPYNKRTEPTPKPNLLLIVASCFACKRVSDIDSGWRALSSYTVIVPRKVLTTILAGKDEVKAFAWRPHSGAPVFIDRESSYSTNPGSIGMQFESGLVEKRSKHFRFYTVSEVDLDEMKIAVSGEVDAVDDSGRPIEIKARPSWARPNAARDFDVWLQATVGAVERIISGGFTATRGVYDGPVTFDKKNVTDRHPNQYHQVCKAEIRHLENGTKFLKEVIQGVETIGKVYKLSGYGSGSPNMTGIDSMDRCTVTKELIEHVAAMKWPKQAQV